MLSANLRWWVHEVELQQVLDAQRLEQQHDIGQVGSLDLRHCRRQEFVLVLTRRVQSVR